MVLNGSRKDRQNDRDEKEADRQKATELPVGLPGLKTYSKLILDSQKHWKNSTEDSHTLFIASPR